jgi:hypothetical protein
MRHLSTLLVGGIAALTLAGATAMAAERQDPTHEITVRLPGGGVERIEYTGNVAPRVIVDSAPLFAPIGFWSDPAFASLDRISAEIDRQMDAMFRQAMSGAPFTNGLNEAVLGKLPEGASSYSMISTSTGNGFCMRTTETTITGNGKPQTVSHQSGNCGNEHPSASHAPATDSNYSTIKYETKAPAPHTTRTAL